MPPEPLDNASNSFPPKLKILDRTISSQSMKGQTAHNRPSSSNPLVEKADMLYLKTSILGVAMFQLSLQVSGVPWPICCPVMSICAVLPGWGLTDTSITSSLDEIFWVCIYELCPLRKVVVVIAWLEIRSLAELFIESCILVQISSVISPSRCMDCIMAYGSTPYVGMAPKKSGGHIKSAQMTRSKYLR